MTGISEQDKHRLKTKSIMTCMKVLLHIFNVLYLFIGIAILAVGIWTQVDLHNYFVLSGIYYANAGWVMVGAGLLIMIIASLGFYCTQKGSVALLNVYGAVILVIFLIQVAAGIAGAVYKDQIGSQLLTGLKTSIENKDAAAQWDMIQKSLQCCGVENSTDWGNTLPNSCCPDTEQPCTAGYAYGPCYHVVLNTIMRDLGYVVGIAFGLVFVQLFGSILAFCLARGMRKHNYEEIY